MSLGARWQTLLEHVEELPEDATLVTPLSGDTFRVTDVQERRIVVEYRDDGGTVPLQRDQFETLFRRVGDAPDGFDLDRLPPDAEPYAAVLSLHPRYEVDERDGTLTETGTTTGSPLVDARIQEAEPGDREEPDIPVYADALLLVDALERYHPTDLDGMETPALVNLYTLLSDVQRTARRTRSLKDEETVLARLEEAGVDPDRVTITQVDAGKVEDALDVTPLSESDLFEVEQSEYVRETDVDEAEKDSRLQGLKDRLAAVDDDTADLKQEIEALEARIEDLTSFDTGTAFHTRSGGG